MIKSDFNLAFTRRRFLKPLISDNEIHELVELEKICFPPPENYDQRTLQLFVSMNGIGLLRWFEEGETDCRLAGFHIFDCFAAELITIDVHPEFRRRGIARRLYDLSLGKLKELGHQSVSCQIATSNDSSLAFHRLYGFKPVKRLRNYYGPGRDAYFLKAPLK